MEPEINNITEEYDKWSREQWDWTEKIMKFAVANRKLTQEQADKLKQSIVRSLKPIMQEHT